MMTINTHISAPPLSNNSEASAVGSSVMDSPQERAYGTFEVSVIDIDSDNEQPIIKPSKAIDYDASDAETHHTCAGDCCVAVSFLWMPFRLETYQIVAFHALNALFAIFASVATVTFYTTKLLLSPVASLTQPLVRAEVLLLRVLLHIDVMLFNFVCPYSERLRVDDRSTAPRDGSSYSAQIYFAVAKLVCSGLPGVVAALTFLWTIRNVVVVLLVANEDPSSPADAMAPVETDVLILMAVIAVYAAAALTKVFAVISRHITIFFCAEYLLYVLLL